LNTYSHILPGMQEDAAIRLDQALKKARPVKWLVSAPVSKRLATRVFFHLPQPGRPTGGRLSK
jgi:hypothetical protein